MPASFSESFLHLAEASEQFVIGLPTSAVTVTISWKCLESFDDTGSDKIDR